MRTLITEQIDGYTIVLGVDRPTVDAVTTRQKIDEKIADDPLILEIIEKQKQAVLLAKEWGRCQKKRRLAAKSQTLEEQYNATCLEIGALHDKVDAKRFEMMQAEPIYFEPKLGELMVSDEVGADHLAKFPVPHGKKLVMYGDYVTDLRGQKYWIKTDGHWEHLEIEKLGEEIPDGGLTVDEMTDETRIDIGQQLKDEYIRGLCGEEKQAELKKALAVALDQAAYMKSKLEIQGDTDALAKSQEWYKAETDRIQELFS
jgi:hypothetical protein